MNWRNPNRISNSKELNFGQRQRIGESSPKMDKILLPKDKTTYEKAEAYAWSYIYGQHFSLANKNLEILEQGIWKLQVKNTEIQLISELLRLKDLRYKNVKDVRILGSIGVAKLNSAIDMVASQRQFVDLDVWGRPFRD